MDYTSFLVTCFHVLHHLALMWPSCPPDLSYIILLWPIYGARFPYGIRTTRPSRIVTLFAGLYPCMCGIKGLLCNVCNADGLISDVWHRFRSPPFPQLSPSCPCASPGTKCGHFSEDMFDDELMTGFVNSVSRCICVGNTLCPCFVISPCPTYEQLPYKYLILILVV